MRVMACVVRPTNEGLRGGDDTPYPLLHRPLRRAHSAAARRFGMTAPPLPPMGKCSRPRGRPEAERRGRPGGAKYSKYLSFRQTPCPGEAPQTNVAGRGRVLRWSTDDPRGQGRGEPEQGGRWWRRGGRRVRPAVVGTMLQPSSPNSTPCAAVRDGGRAGPLPPARIVSAVGEALEAALGVPGRSLPPEGALPPCGPPRAAMPSCGWPSSRPWATSMARRSIT